MTADSAVPPTTTGDYETAIREALHKYALDPDATQGSVLLSSQPFFHVAAQAVVEFVAAEVAAARADDVERIRAVCRLLLNSGDITPMGARLIEQAADRSVTSHLRSRRD